MLGIKRFFANYFACSSFSIVGPGKKKGEDAYFTSSDVISIADGVGGWTDYGIDPSLYAWELMRNVEKFSNSLNGAERNSTNILTKAAGLCKEEGSSTCSLVLLEKEKARLDTINIGDSGFYIYRKGKNGLKLKDQSKEVVRYFNHPLQLGTNGDKLESAWKKEIKVKDKDLIVMFTDGVCDNLFEEMVREIVVTRDGDLEGIAKGIAEKALEMCKDTSYDSPFSKKAREVKRNYTGGKPDDITVVVALVNIIKKLKKIT